jgi:hypothetical protein
MVAMVSRRGVRGEEHHVTLRRSDAGQLHWCHRVGR